MKQLTETEILTKMFMGMFKQNARSVNSDGACLYRAPCGNKCIIGHGIDDSEYDESFNTQGATDYSVRKALNNSGGKCISATLAYDLQDSHDEADSNTTPFNQQFIKNLSWREAPQHVIKLAKEILAQVENEK